MKSWIWKRHSHEIMNMKTIFYETMSMKPKIPWNHEYEIHISVKTWIWNGIWWNVSCEIHAKRFVLKTIFWLNSSKFWPKPLIFWPKSLRFQPKFLTFSPKTLKSEIVAKTLDFKYKTFEILTKTFEILTQTFKLLTKTFEILTKTSENLRTWYFVENHRDFNQHLCDFTQNLR